MNCPDVWQVAALGVLDVVQQGARCGYCHGESAAAKAVEILSLELPLQVLPRARLIELPIWLATGRAAPLILRQRT